ncbi:peptidoglycan-binding protein [Kitasatospora sp. NBC_00374]|uniref:peptidoglycan-binding domain-containing protein n=1 Tax=Kitasatospora sp. NBC_00374 TaxID=2975964 RepID=UPI0030E432ED
MPGRYCPTCGSLRASTACHENLGRTDVAPPATPRPTPPSATAHSRFTAAPAPAPTPIPAPTATRAPDLGTFTLRPHRTRGSHRRVRHPRLQRARRSALLASTGLAVLGGGLMFALSATPEGQVDRALPAPPVERLDAAPTASPAPPTAPTPQRSPSGKPARPAPTGSPAIGPTDSSPTEPTLDPSPPPATDPAPASPTQTEPPPPSTSPTPVTSPPPTLLQPGTRGPAVQRMKKLLQRIGCVDVTSTDSFDPATRDLIIRYQTARKVNDGALGVYGPHTKATLEAESRFDCR